MAKYQVGQSHNHDEMYVKIGEGGGGVTDHGELTGLGDNDHPQYLLTTGKAADSDKLDGVDSTGFVNTTAAQTIGGIKTFDSLPVLPTTAPGTNNPIRKGLADTTYANLTTAQTIAGVKTFSSIPVLPASDPTAINQAVRKSYVDTQIGAIKGLFRGMTRTAPYSNTSVAAGYDVDVLASSWGVPAGVSAIYVLMLVQGATAGSQIVLSKGATHDDSVSQIVVVANQYNKNAGIIPLSATGYFNVWNPGATSINLWVYISGYFT